MEAVVQRAEKYPPRLTDSVVALSIFNRLPVFPLRLQDVIIKFLPKRTGEGKERDNGRRENKKERPAKVHFDKK